MRKADLERALDAVPKHPSPSPDLEQYRTPPGVAAQFLRLVADDGAIADRRVLDLGCGTGVLAIGAALLGARLATGVDIDAQSTGLAQQASVQLGVAQRTWFVTADLAHWQPEPDAFDTVIMNPPFGAQQGNKHADRLFLERAAQAVQPAGTVWFLALERTEAFLDGASRRLGGELEKVAAWDYPLEATMAHHKRDVQTVRVGAYRMSWV